MEVKLRKSTRLSTGQKSAKAHVKEGDGKFEVRSKKVKVKADRSATKQDNTITVTDYKRINKYNN